MNEHKECPKEAGKETIGHVDHRTRHLLCPPLPPPLSSPPLLRRQLLQPRTHRRSYLLRHRFLSTRRHETPPLLGIDAAVATTVIPAADGLTSAITAAANDGSLLIAHGGHISSYDWSLSHTSIDEQRDHRCRPLSRHMSHNHLCGSIPVGEPFDERFDESSFENNDCLCGNPLLKTC
ncbi:hypothetical protein ACFE04_007196 [Oxalis oulophora]